MNRIFTILFCACVFTQVQAQIPINGMVRNYTALSANEDPDLVMFQNTFRLNFEKRSDKGAFNADIYTYLYAKNITPEINIKQLYADLYFENVDLRLGRQQIIWGKADGVFITDIVSPKDLREFLLPDFTEIRQGIDALNTSFYTGNHTFSLVLSPVFSPTIEPTEESIWHPNIQYPSDSVKFDYSGKDVSLSLKNSETFFRWSAMLSAIDFELVGAWMWDDDPTLHMKKYVSPTTEGVAIDSIIISPKHHRLAMGGGSFSSTAKGFIFKGEAGYYHEKKFNTNDPTIVDGVIEGDYLHYMIGLSYTLAGIDLHGQFIQKILINHNSYYKNDKFENMFTLLLHKSLLRETLNLNLFSYIGLNSKDALIRPSVEYDISDGIKFIVGANIFVGDSGYFGQFDENDIGYIKLSYSF